MEKIQVIPQIQGQPQIENDQESLSLRSEIPIADLQDPSSSPK